MLVFPIKFSRYFFGIKTELVALNDFLKLSVTTFPMHLRRILERSLELETNRKFHPKALHTTKFRMSEIRRIDKLKPQITLMSLPPRVAQFTSLSIQANDDDDDAMCGLYRVNERLSIVSVL